MNLLPIMPHEVAAPQLSIQHRAALLTAVNVVGADLGTVTVAVSYPEKQTNTEPRLPGRDYVEIPGVGPDIHIGRLSVGRRVDNAANRRKDVVGKVKLLINSLTRANGVHPARPTGICVEGLTSFVIIGFQPTEPQVPEPAPEPAPEQGTD